MKYLLIFLLLFPILDAATSWAIINDYSPIWHALEAAKYGVLVIFIIAMIQRRRIFDFYRCGQWLIVALTLRWIIFDIALNKMMGWNWYYVGNTGIIDQFIGYWGFWIKPVLLIFSILVICSTFLDDRDKSIRVYYKSYPSKSNIKRLFYRLMEGIDNISRLRKW